MYPPPIDIDRRLRLLGSLPEDGALPLLLG
jgi:hypothetical protein